MAVQASDVLIVGGGPAGSTCAWQLGKAGFDVLLVDRATFPRDKPCAGWITPAVVEMLHIDPADYGRDLRWQPITGFRCGMIGGRQTEVDYGEPVSFGIRRVEFDRYLLQRSGARSVLGEKVETIDRNDDQWLINGKYSAPVLIGAGGNFCPVARMLAARQKQGSLTVVAQEVEFAMEEPDRVRVQPEVPELFFCDDLLGYGWCFRKQDYLNIGLGRVDASDLSSHVTEFCRSLRARGRVDCDLSARFRGHAYRLFDATVDPLCGDGWLLAGDSAGLAYSYSGEGIRPAVESGLIAADVIANAEGDYRNDRLESYAARIRERFGQPQSKLDWGSVLPASWLQRAAGWLVPTPWFARRVIMNRWFLRANEKPLQLSG